MKIDAQQVKALREMTQAAMMACRKALEEADGDLEKAKQLLREKGAAQAAKKADRVASEGIVASYINDKQAALVMLCCETDFVARNENFVAFAEKLAQLAAANQITSVEKLKALSPEDGKTIEELRHELIAQLGENIILGDVASIQAQGQIATYQHGTKIAVLVDYSGGDDTLAKDIAMQIAASNPLALVKDELDQDVLSAEEAIIRKQLEESGKPVDILEKIVLGKMNSFAKEHVLLDQEFVKNPDFTVSQLLDKNNATIHSFIRIQIG